jgi:hypothetical protein
MCFRVMGGGGVENPPPHARAPAHTQPVERKERARLSLTQVGDEATPAQEDGVEEPPVLPEAAVVRPHIVNAQSAGARAFPIPSAVAHSRRAACWLLPPLAPSPETKEKKTGRTLAWSSACLLAWFGVCVDVDCVCCDEAE